jgi:hypothetical protein
MKSCPKCNRSYDDSLSFCLEDGSALLSADSDAETVFRKSSDTQSLTNRNSSWKYAFLILVPLLLVAFGTALFLLTRPNQSKDLNQNQAAAGAPGNSTNTPPANTAQNATVNKENQNINSNNGNSTPDLKPAPPKRKDKPRFSDYPATDTSQGRNAPLVLSTARDRQFKTFLKENAIQPPNFAGHYILATMGCGTQCAQAALIDASTGLVYWFPETINPIDMNDSGDDSLIKFRSDSKLIIFPTIKEAESTDYGYLRHYVFENNRFYLVYSVKEPTSF